MFNEANAVEDNLTPGPFPAREGEKAVPLSVSERG